MSISKTSPPDGIGTIAGIDNLIEQTKDMTEDEMIAIAYGLPAFIGSLYCARMELKYGKHVGV
jgi:hypothetical protein